MNLSATREFDRGWGQRPECLRLDSVNHRVVYVQRGEGDRGVAVRNCYKVNSGCVHTQFPQVFEVRDFDVAEIRALNLVLGQGADSQKRRVVGINRCRARNHGRHFEKRARLPLVC